MKTEQSTEYHELAPYKYKDQPPQLLSGYPGSGGAVGVYGGLSLADHMSQADNGSMTGYLEPLQAATTSSATSSATSQMSPQQQSSAAASSSAAAAAGLMNGRGLLSGLNMPLDPSDPFLRDPTVRYPVPITDINGNADVHPSSGSHSLTTLGRPTTTYSDLSGSNRNNNNNSSGGNGNSNNSGSQGGGTGSSNQSTSDGKWRARNLT